MNTKFIIGAILGVVVAVGGSVYAVEESSLKDFVIGLGAKVLELESRVNELSLEVKDKLGTATNAVLGGLSNTDQFNARWFVAGPSATTTASDVYESRIHLKTYQADQTWHDYWRNTTDANVFVEPEQFVFSGTASSSFRIAIATSTRHTTNAADCCSVLKIGSVAGASTTGASATLGAQKDFMLRYFIATSTNGFVLNGNKWVSSTTPRLMVKQGEYLDMVLMDAYSSERCVGNNDVTAVGVSGKCEAASSTRRGFNIDVWFTIHATTTPREDNTR